VAPQLRPQADALQKLMDEDRPAIVRQSIGIESNAQVSRAAPHTSEIHQKCGLASLLQNLTKSGVLQQGPEIAKPRG
jgi:hypothetical protein